MEFYKKFIRETYDHVIEIRVEVLSLRNLHAVRWLIVVAGADIVDVIRIAWSQSDLRKVGRVNAPISVPCLVLRDVGRVDPIVDHSISTLPLLVVVLLEVVLSWADRIVLAHQSSQLQLPISLIKQHVELLVHDPVTGAAIPGVDHKASPNRSAVEGAQKSILGPLQVSMVRSDFRHHFFIALDAPIGTDVVAIDKVLH